MMERQIDLYELWQHETNGEQLPCCNINTAFGMLRRNEQYDEYELYAHGELVCVDGEAVEVITKGENSIVLHSMETGRDFILSADEYAACIDEKELEKE